MRIDPGDDRRLDPGDVPLCRTERALAMKRNDGLSCRTISGLT